MRIRYPFAGAFVFILILAAYIGLLPHSASPSIPTTLQPNDKFLHLVTFFVLSLVFYWILDTTRRRCLQLTLVVCTLALGIGSEIIQGLLPNDRAFDPFDLVANLIGSLGAVGLCSWYHRRMLERRRKARFGALGDEHELEHHDDVELGMGLNGSDRGLGPQESGVLTLEQEVDNWDENAVDSWDADEGADEYAATRREDSKSSAAPATGEGVDGKKRSD
ncbi:VanZ family protein [Aspergillus clavatus NRRL 1]|uniref:VanZ domain protein, putative n=1 Tax=Aspergillus clavatus (strain ATCC 1007 / CBS 513.65 / DSM 816 / NCTC 3887 / NRRL 1 / QM 1276 / 107) TaxID=344612 RepID=A1CKK2_ASPCL|nr:VanZ domain protein, putative [Aspergillus clavatus NRRL 1]EAW09676.1 VanZ domain protein, putative [Aspergillus clavatus NRRL 1]